jgi:glycosyltransferase 2 family protein
MSQGKRRKWVLAVEIALAVIIVVAVGLHFRNLLKGIDPAQLPLRLRVEYLIPAGLLYLLAHLCWSTFWVRLLHFEGVKVSWYVGLRTYYISQFGKYVPGKVLVPLMRMGMLRKHGAHPVPVGVTAVYETLTSMAAGAMLGVLFLPALGIVPPELSGKLWILFGVAALPLGLGVLNRLVAWYTKKKRGPDARPLPSPSIFLLAQGLLHGACGYCLLALSLGLTIRALIPAIPEWTPESYPVDMAAVALSYVAGFVIAVAPGGLGAREIAMQLALTPQLTPAFGGQAPALAVVIALTLRLTWTIAEVALGLLLYMKKPALPPPVPHDPTIEVHHERPHPRPHHMPEPSAEAQLLSLVIPVYNERESLAALHAEISAVAAKLTERVEIIFIDDGSKDSSWDIVRELSAKDDRVRGIRFRRNFGKAAALAAGFGAAKGGTIITMDADLQDDPHEIPNFLAKLSEGFDVVSGWKKVRHDPWHKVFPSRVFNKFLSVLTGVHLHDHNCGMKAYRTEALHEVHMYGEMHRFVPVLAFARGFKVGELVIQHRARKFGYSKYGWKRFIKGGLDVVTVRLLTGFARRPQHFIGAWGLGLMFAGLLGAALCVVVATLGVFLEAASAFALVLVGAVFSGIAVLLGGQCILVGLIAEMIVARKWLDNEVYSVAERTDGA